MLETLRFRIRKHADPARAAVSARYFKTGPGEYGAGDVFAGLTVPQSRAIAKAFANLDFATLKKLLRSKTHEERLIALFILVARFQKADATERGRICDFYLDHLAYVNNWDLVDSSADKILGAFLAEKSKSLLVKLARSESVWERRVAMIATFYGIRRGEFETALVIAERLSNDPHDLIHKAVGWMLREIGKRSPSVEEEFLKRHAARMPRTMLRYAIEKFPEAKRRRYLAMRDQ